MINPLVDKLIQEFPGLEIALRPKNASTMEHYFYDTKTDAYYTSHTNGYVRRTIYKRKCLISAGTRHERLNYQMNPRKVTSKSGSHTFYSLIMLRTEDERLKRLAACIRNYRNTQAKAEEKRYNRGW